MKFYNLTNAFFSKYPQVDFPEFERKTSRPYKMLITEINGYQVAIPLRSHIRHAHQISTVADKGLDFSKSVILLDPSYIDLTFTVPVDNREITILSRKGEHVIKQKYLKYIKDYTSSFNKLVDGKVLIGSVGYKKCYNTVHRSTLQYFHSIIEIKDVYNPTQFTDPYSL